jgi:hypothetical protein
MPAESAESESSSESEPDECSATLNMDVHAMPQRSNGPTVMDQELGLFKGHVVTVCTSESERGRGPGCGGLVRVTCR